MSLIALKYYWKDVQSLLFDWIKKIITNYLCLLECQIGILCVLWNLSIGPNNILCTFVFVAKFIFETELTLPQKFKSEKELENSELNEERPSEEPASQNHTKKFVELMEESRIPAEDLMVGCYCCAQTVSCLKIK